MYTIYVYDGEYWQNVLISDDRYTVETATLSESVNAAPVLTFKVYEGHPSLSYLLAAIESPLPTTAQPTIMARRDGSTVFEGRIYQHALDDLTGAHEFACEGMLARLNDYTITPYSYSGTVSGYLDMLLTECEGALAVGNVTVSDPNNYIVRSSEQPVMLWDEIADKCIGSPLGGFLEMRNGYIVDWLAQPSASTATQDMEAGINLTGLNITVQPREMYSGVLAYGAEVGVTDSKGVPYYWNLSQASAYDVPVPSGYTLSGMTLFKDSLVSQIGQRVCIVHYESITQVSNLMNRAVAFLNAQSATPIIQVGAVDLADAGYNADAIECGSTVQITGATFDASMMCTQISRDLLDPASTTFAFGAPDNISSSGSGSGAGGNSSISSPNFWHTEVTTSGTAHDVTGFSTLPLEDVLTSVENRYSEVDGGAVWINEIPTNHSSFEVRTNQTVIRNVSATLPLYENTFSMTGVSATIQGKQSDNINAAVLVDGYNGNVNITATNAVNVSGDTNITGNASVTRQLNVHEAISTICDTVDSSASDNGVTSTVYRPIGFRDSAQKYMGYIQLVAATSGYSQMEFSARKPVNGSNVDNAIRLRVTADGSRVVSVSAPDEWRAALGFNTWTTVSAANWITWSSGWSGTTVSVQYNAALGVVRVYAYIKTSAAQTAGNKTLGTVASTYRPKTMPVSIPSLTNGSHAAYLDTNGALKANVSALSANGTLYFCGYYFIGA